MIIAPISGVLAAICSSSLLYSPITESVGLYHQPLRGLSGASGNVGISPTALLLSDSLYTFHSLIHPQAAEKLTPKTSASIVPVQPVVSQCILADSFRPE